MNVVVERGLARCPRCAASADYCFIECGTEAIRYEIECRMCGELYCEENSTSPVIFSIADFVPPAPAVQLAPGVWARLVGELRRRWSAASSAASSAVASAVARIRRQIRGSFFSE
jgi:hypothetical protein